MIVRLLGSAALALTLLGCQPDKANLDHLVAEQRLPLGQVPPTDCTDRSAACSQLHAQHGARCLNSTEVGDAAERARNRACALSDFRTALELAPDDRERLIAGRGLAEAVHIDRDNTPDAAARNADRTELDRVAAQLKTMADGAPYGGYYAADNALHRVLQRLVPADQACATLDQARAELSGAGSARNAADADFRRRTESLRNLLETARRQRSCA